MSLGWNSDAQLHHEIQPTQVTSNTRSSTDRLDSSPDAGSSSLLNSDPLFMGVTRVTLMHANILPAVSLTE